jgi:sarcosine oxidase delta subunit
MLFCPYCLRKQEPSDKGKDFTDLVGFRLTDNANKKEMMLKIHSQGCGRVFIVISDMKQADYVACFKLPQEDWVKAIFYKSQV